MEFRDRRFASNWSLLLAAAVCAALWTTTAASAQEPGKQVTALKARHAAGQTILAWQEPDSLVLLDAIRVGELRRIAQDSERKTKVRYRVYRSDRPIASVEGLRPIAEVPPLSCWNMDFYGGEVRPLTRAFRYVVEEGREPVPPGSGICAYNPSQAGEAYYAVTVALGGKENKTLGRENAMESPVRESVGPGIPVLQRVETPKEFNYVAGSTLYYYTRWESPPNCAAEGKPLDYVVAIPAKPAKPAPVGIHLHCWGAQPQQRLRLVVQRREGRHPAGLQPNPVRLVDRLSRAVLERPGGEGGLAKGRGAAVHPAAHALLPRLDDHQVGHRPEADPRRRQLHGRLGLADDGHPLSRADRLGDLLGGRSRSRPGRRSSPAPTPRSTGRGSGTCGSRTARRCGTISTTPGT